MAPCMLCPNGNVALRVIQVSSTLLYLMENASKLNIIFKLEPREFVTHRKIVSRCMHLSHVQSVHPLQANPPNIRNVSSIYSSACFVMEKGKSVAVSMENISTVISKYQYFSAVHISLTIPHLHGIQIDYFHFLDILTTIFSLLVGTTDNHHLPFSTGCIGDQAT